MLKARVKSGMRRNSYQSPFTPQAFFNANRLDAIMRNMPKGKCRVLDVGCGYGTLVKRVELVGHECFGVEPDLVAFKAAKAGGLKVKRGFAERLPYPSGYFDVVVLTEVIEHLRNPESAVAEIRRVLKKGGLLIVTTPNVASLWLVIERLWDWYARLDYHHEHFFYFSTRSLASLVERNGFRVKNISTIHLFSFLLSPASVKIAELARRLENVVLSRIRVGLQIVLAARKL